MYEKYVKGYFKPAFRPNFAIMKMTKAIMRKSITTPMKSPIPKLIPFPIGMMATAFRQSPPSMNALGIGMMRSCTSAVTTLPITVPTPKVTPHVPEPKGIIAEFKEFIGKAGVLGHAMVSS